MLLGDNCILKKLFDGYDEGLPETYYTYNPANVNVRVCILEELLE
jgi:hypothetical protein